MLFGPVLKNKLILPEDQTQDAQLPLVPHYRVITSILCLTVDFLIYYHLLYTCMYSLLKHAFMLTFILSTTLVINDSFISPTLKIVNNTIIINNIIIVRN